ncbi:YcaO-like family protein [Breoghania sp.]|uniref:YcaO-like family protein n=1 Tax=Breoghania sp. TaxID=2065378 RepID=UPI0029CA3500|nr:YcaO-like family protein [Breoghania sp.]
MSHPPPTFARLSIGNTVFRIEPDGADLLVSPPLGHGSLCERCWVSRRLATLEFQGAPTDICARWTARSYSSARAIARISPLAQSPVQRSALARVLRNVRTGLQTNAMPDRPAFMPLVTRIGPDGSTGQEPVLPVADCDCGPPAPLRTSGFAAIVGRAAGIVNEIIALPALPGEPDYPVVHVARLANSRHDPNRPFWQGSSGKGATQEAALLSTLGEAVENYAHACRDEAWEAPASPVVCRNELVVKPTTSHRIAGLNHSNGLGCARGIEAAVLHGVEELIERHLFYAAWYGCSPADEMHDLPPALEGMTEEFRRLGLATRLIDLGNLGNVTAVAAVCHPVHPSPARPQFCLGLAGKQTACSAAESAFLEMAQIYRGLTHALANPALAAHAEGLVTGRAEIGSPFDHGLLFSRIPATQVPAPFGLGPRRPKRALQEENPLADLRYVNMTPRDLWRFSDLAIARALAPRLIPFHFGLKGLETPRAFALDVGIEDIHPLS